MINLLILATNRNIEFGVGIGKINRNINEETGFMWTRQIDVAWSRFIPS
jgi:hypothetical protein